MKLAFLLTLTALASGAHAVPFDEAFTEQTDLNYCWPGQACFPSDAELNAFNRSVNGALHAQRPVNAVCYRKDTLFNQAQCDEVSANYNSTNWRIAHSPAYVYYSVENCGVATCNSTSVTANSTCDQGSVPEFSMSAKSAKDVVEYVQFVSRHNLRPIVKNTGHDLLGRSAGIGFSLWTHAMQNITHQKTFKPVGCNNAYKHALTVGAGVQWRAAYEAAHNHSRTIVGGGSPTVGATGGYVLGGGHSILSPSYGIAADNVLEMSIVTPDGQHRTISPCHDPDLFRAVRGGGGGTWGVTTAITYYTYPEVPIYAFNVAAGETLSKANFSRLMLEWTRLAPSLSDLGVGGSFTLYNQSLSISTIIPSDKTSFANFQRTLQPFTSWLAEHGVIAANGTSTIDGKPLYANATSYWDLFSHAIAPAKDTPTVAGGPIGSRIVPSSYYHSATMKLSDIIVRGAEQVGSFVIVGLVGPERYAREHGGIRAMGTSVNPAWYRSIWHVLSSSTVEDLRALAPDGAVYFGESAATEPKPAQSYWGEHYEMLAAVKKRIDPKNMFAVWHGVGSGTLEMDAPAKQSKVWECYTSYFST